MIPKRYTHGYTPGEDFKLVLSLTDGDGVAIDLTDAEAELTFKRDGTTVFEFVMTPDAEQGEITIDEAGGEITLYAAYTLVEEVLTAPAEGTLFVTWADDYRQALLCVVLEIHTCDGV